MPKPIREATRALEATAVADKPGRFLITLITPGQGSSGYYPTECLEAAGADAIFAAGTHMYLDHPSETEKYDRPERSVRDLGAVLTEDAYWNGEALVAEAQAFSQHRGLLEEMKDFIGVSIRASADVEESGPKGRTIKKIVAAESVDFVTRAGRGGSFQLLESARPTRVNERATRRGVAEATVNDRREALVTIARDTHGSDDVWVWVRDFDDTNVWFDIESGDDAGTYQQAYTSGEDDLPTALTGERVEVRAITQYVPVNPAGQPNTQESKEDTMPQIEEARLSQLEEAFGRVPTLESERDTAIAERDAALTEANRYRDEAREALVSRVIAESASAHNVEFDDLQVAGLRAGAPVADGVLDEAAFRTTATEAAARLAESQGVGRVRGFGHGPHSTRTPGDGTAPTTDQVNEARAAAFGRQKGA